MRFFRLSLSVSHPQYDLDLVESIEGKWKSETEFLPIISFFSHFKKYEIEISKELDRVVEKELDFEWKTNR